MTDRIKRLLEDFLDTLRSRGEMSAEEIVEWGESRGIHLPFTVYIIVKDAVEREEVEASSEEVNVYPEYNILLPKWVRYASPPGQGGGQAEAGEAGKPVKSEAAGTAPPSGLLSFLGGEARAKASPQTKTVKKREKQAVKAAKSSKARKKPAGGTILAFIGGRETAEKKSLKEEKTAKEAEEAETPPNVEEALSSVRDLLGDERYVKALRYLSHYWSVGLYRFYKDMERSGVKEPREILKTLYRRGLIEIDELEVINAKPELRALKEVLRKSLSLADVFG